MIRVEMKYSRVGRITLSHLIIVILTCGGRAIRENMPDMANAISKNPYLQLIKRKTSTGSVDNAPVNHILIATTHVRLFPGHAFFSLKTEVKVLD